ncbi:unnamed protein product [Caenorhabditis nigoni]
MNGAQLFFLIFIEVENPPISRSVSDRCAEKSQKGGRMGEREGELSKETSEYGKNHCECIEKECVKIDNRIQVGPFPQGSVDVQNIDDKTGIQYEKANRRIKKDKRSKLPRAHGQKLQQQKKISKDQQCQL